MAYAAALARSALGCMPERVKVTASANIIKNVKSVVVPNTGGLRGIAAAAAAYCEIDYSTDSPPRKRVSAPIIVRVP